MMRVVVRPGTMERAAVIPHDQITRPPLMLVDKARLGCERDQLGEKRAALLDWPANDVRCMSRKVERLSARAGMDADQGLRNGRQCSALLIRKIRVTDEPSRMEDRMLCNEVIDLLFGPFVERIIGGTKVREFGFASRRRHFARRH